MAIRATTQDWSMTNIEYKKENKVFKGELDERILAILDKLNSNDQKYIKNFINNICKLYLNKVEIIENCGINHLINSESIIDKDAILLISKFLQE